MRVSQVGDGTIRAGSEQGETLVNNPLGLQKQSWLDKKTLRNT